MAGDSASSFSRSTVLQVRGELALLEKQPALAVDLFQRALGEYPDSLSHIGHARAYEALSDRAAADKAWQAVAAARGEILRDGYPPDWAIAHLARGRLLESADVTAARGEYGLVVEAWRAADPLSLVREPTEALRRLDAAAVSRPTAPKR